MHRTLAKDMIRFGYLATRSQLRALGYTDRDLRRHIADGQLWPIRRSWLAHAGASADATRAVALGGRLGAASALGSHGVWVTRSDGLWVATAQGAGRLPKPGYGERRMWVRERFGVRTDKQWRMSVPDSLLQFARIGTEPDVIASFDSALNSGLLNPTDLVRIFELLPRRLRRIRRRLRRQAQSGLETLLRVAAEEAGWKVDIQVQIVGVGRVDVLIDGWVVIELDSAQWHDDELSRDKDSRRDAELTLLGYRYQRFRAAQVVNDMPKCLDVIRTILAAGRPVALTDIAS